MEKKAIIGHQYNGIILHRIVYITFTLIHFLVLLEDKEISIKDFICSFVFILVCIILEEVFYHKDYFNSEKLLRVYRYLQSVITFGMLCFSEKSSDTTISYVALLIMFLVDFFLALNVVDRQDLVIYMIYISAPIMLILFVAMASININEWMYILFDIIILMVVLFYDAFALCKYVDSVERRLFDQKNQMDDMVKKNNKIVDMQNKLQDTNFALNTQKNDLINANRQIREANAEMTAQADILHYIALSFDVSKISNQITDAIMDVKGLGFCAVYIKKDVYRNKHANYVIKTDINQLQGKIKNNIAGIYDDMIAKGVMEKIYHGELREIFPFLKDVNIQTVYVKVLGLDDDMYGLFMLGDARPNLFDDKMSFYDVIIAQYDIAISNAKVYSDMQYMAQKDGLTGINNRIHFNSLFKKETDRVVAENGFLSVALLDIDKFKSVNDTYGHLAGDEVIKRIATVTEDCIEQYDGFVCRYGGEEFVAVLPNRKLEVATPIIEELFEALCKQVVEFNEYRISMSVSVGLTSYPEVCVNPDDLLKRADWCMYYAKEHGRHQIYVDDGSIQRD